MKHVHVQSIVVLHIQTISAVENDTCFGRLGKSISSLFLYEDLEPVPEFSFLLLDESLFPLLHDLHWHPNDVSFDVAIT